MKGGITLEHAAVVNTKETYKLYVETGVVYKPDGEIIPQYVRLGPDGEMFLIDKVFRHESMSSTKAGGCGICFFVQIKGQNAKLFYEEARRANKWFVETKRPIYVNDDEAC